MANVFYRVSPPVVNGEGGLREAFRQLGPFDPPREGRLRYLGKGFAHGIPTPISPRDGSVPPAVLPFFVQIFERISFHWEASFFFYARLILALN